MSKCIKNSILPKSFQTRPLLRTKKGYALTKEHNGKMLRATRDKARQQYHELLKRINEVTGQLEDTMSLEDFNNIKNVTKPQGNISSRKKEID